MYVVNLRRREAVKLKVRILRMKGAQQVFIPLDFEIRVQATLHQDTCAAERNRLVYLLIDFVERANVSLWMIGATIESAEGADYVADVRVVYVAVNDVCDDRIRVKAFANLVGSKTYANKIIRF